MTTRRSKPMADALEKIQEGTADKILERVDKFGGWLDEALKQLAEKLGTTVEYLWTAFVQRQFAEGVAQLAIAVLAFAVGFWVLHSGKKLGAYLEKKNHFNDGSEAFFSGMGYAVLFICIL